MAARPSKTKVVVRKLPPMLAEEGFRAATDKVLAQLPTSWFAYCPGKVSAKHMIFSRAYINFESPEGVVAFKAAFDGHVFVGSRGNQYRCSVEYAPYQKTPQPTKKKDRRDGTIASDPDYLEFCKQLEEGPVSLPSASAQLEAQERESGAAGGGSGDSAPVTTALMQYLQDRYSARPGLKLGALKKLKREEDRKGSKAADEKTLLKKKHNEKADGKGAGKEAVPAKLGGKKGGQVVQHGGLQQQQPAGPAKVLLKRPAPVAAGASSGPAGVGNSDGKGKAKGKGAKDADKQHHGQDRHTSAEPPPQQQVPVQKQQQPKPGQRQAAAQHDTHTPPEQRKIKQDKPYAKGHDREHARGHDREHARGHDREHARGHDREHARGHDREHARGHDGELERTAKAQPQERPRQGGQPGQGSRPPSAAAADAASTSSTPPAPAAPNVLQRAPQPAAAPPPTADNAAAAEAAAEVKRKVRRGFQAYVPGASRLSSARGDGDRNQAG